MIRAPEAGDFDQWSELWSGYLGFYETALSADIHQTLFSRLLSDDPRCFRGFVAECDGQIVGLVHYVFHPHAWRVEEVCYLQDLYVDGAQRGTGLGRALIERVYAAADAAGNPRVYWLTQDTNAQARALYDRVGQLTPFIRYNRPAP